MEPETSSASKKNVIIAVYPDQFQASSRIHKLFPNVQLKIGSTR
jgi:hypothetical protein